jgi:YD repeat-containing protein
MRLALAAAFWTLAVLRPATLADAQGGQPDGAPSPASIDTASYELAARWDPSQNQIDGSATITYRNPSGDTLNELWLKLYLNAFRGEDTQWMREANGAHRGSSFDPQEAGWIRLERLQLVDTGEDLLPPVVDPDATVLRVPLPAARTIEPGETIRLEVAWTSQLPRVFARTGVAGTFVMAGQWYPKLAVYDRGAWDTEPWHANSEFFADFGSYSLALTVPANYVTGATGVREDMTGNADGSITVNYWAESVSDLAWTAWPEYRMATRVVETGGKLVELELLAPRSMSPDEDQRFLGTAEQSLQMLGAWFGTYPWPKLTLVVPAPDAPGAGGMEYPTLVTLENPVPAPFGMSRGIRVPEIVTAHEIAHEWVPMQLATNEGREAWLDEGFADYATTRILARLHGPDRSVLELGPLRLGYEAVQRSQYLLAGVHQPLAQPSWEYPDFVAYGATVYSKGTMVLFTLERTIGEERFLAAMHQHFDRWRWRHPTTADLEQSLEGSLGTSLDGYFTPLVFGTGVAEYAVDEADARHAVVVRRGDTPLPVEIATTYADGRVERQAWDGQGERLDITAQGSEIRRVQIDPDRTLDVEPRRLDDGLDVAPSPVPLLAVAARLLGLVQAMLLAGSLG